MGDQGRATRSQKPPSGSDNRRLLRLTIDVFRSCEHATELADGYTLAFPDDATWRARLEEVAAHWRNGKPLFRVAVDRGNPPGTLSLRLTGPPQAKEHLARLLAHAQSDALAEHLWWRLSLCGRALARAEFVLRRLSSPLRVLPDFLIIGAAKCGTSSLYGHLTKHPSIATARRKEVYFFDHAWTKGLRYYRSFFPTRLAKRRGGAGFRTGEATPCYLFHPHAPRRVQATVPDVRLIALLRNPVDRAYSDYCMKLRRDIETLSFEEAIEREPERIDGQLDRMLENEHYFSYDRWNFAYLARGHYAEQLARWLEHFPREQLLVLASEDFFDTPADAYAAVLRHLGLPRWEPETTRKSNFMPYPDMSAQARQRLVDYFRPHNERLYELLGRRFAWDR